MESDITHPVVGLVAVKVYVVVVVGEAVGLDIVELLKSVVGVHT